MTEYKSRLDKGFSGTKFGTSSRLNAIAAVVECVTACLDEANLDRKSALQTWYKEKIQATLSHAELASKADGVSLAQIVELFPADEVLKA